AGKVKLLAMTNTVRAPTAPDVPTVTEAGHPELTLDGLVGFFGPPGMPLALRQRIAEDVRAVADPTIAARLADTGQVMNIGPATDDQRANIAPIAKELGIKPTQ